MEGSEYVTNATATTKIVPPCPILKENFFKIKIAIKPRATPNRAPNPTCEKSIAAISPAPMALEPSIPYFAASSATNTTVSI